MLEIEGNHWILAEEYFKNITQSQKFIPEIKCSYCFIKAQDGNIYAMARKKFRAEDIFAQSDFADVVKVQNRNNEEFTCKISTQNTANKRKTYTVLQKLEGQPLKKILGDIRSKKRPLLHTLEKDLIALKTTLALIQLYSQGKIHGHISLQTIMINLENDIAVSLLEFDNSLRLQKGSMSPVKERQTFLRQYCAPEVIIDGLYTSASDCYSLGVVFKALNRAHWAINLMTIAPTSRANLHEILLDIYLKITNENPQLSDPHAKLIDEVESLILDYFGKKLEDGVSFDYLVRNNLIKNFINEKIFYALALDLCLSYYMTFKKNPRVRIFNTSNFTIKCKQESLEVEFYPQDTTIDKTLAPPEYENNIYSDRSAVFFLSKMLEFFGILYEPGLRADYHARPDIVTFINDLYEAVKRSPLPEEYQASLDEIYTYLLNQKIQQLLIFSSSEDDFEEDTKVEPFKSRSNPASSSSSACARDDDRDQLIFAMDDLEDALNDCAQKPAQHFLTQYPSRTALAASCMPSTDKSQLPQSDKTKAIEKITLHK